MHLNVMIKILFEMNLAAPSTIVQANFVLSNRNRSLNRELFTTFIFSHALLLPQVWFWLEGLSLLVRRLRFNFKRISYLLKSGLIFHKTI